jgi:hypothetical protein
MDWKTFKHPAKLLQTMVIACLLSGFISSALWAQTYVNRVADADSFHLEELRITSNTTWSAAGSPYIVEGWDWLVHIENGATLTIEAGATVEFPTSRDGSGLSVNEGSVLNILGNDSTPVYLRGYESDTWSGIRYNPGSSGNIEYAQISKAGHISSGWQAWHPEASIYVDSASVTLNNNLIDSSEGNGIKVNYGTSAQIQQNTITNCGTDPTSETSTRSAFYIYQLGAGLNLSDNSSSGCGYNAIYLRNQIVEEEVTLFSNPTPYYVEGYDANLIVAAGGILTLNEGVVMKFNSARDGSALITYGTLNTYGSDSLPVIFTSHLDDTGGELDTSTTQPYAGIWSGLRFHNNGIGELHNTQVLFAGHISSGWQAWHPEGAVWVDSATFSAQNLSVEHSQNVGILYKDADITIDSVYFNGNDGAVVSHQIGYTVNTLPAIDKIYAGDNGYNGIYLSGTFGSDLHMENTYLPYIIQGWATVPDSVSLQVSPGAAVLFRDYDVNYKSGLIVYGDLRAQGTTTDSIRFSSVLDFSGFDFPVSRDTVMPMRGDWNGVIFREGSTGELDYSQIFYAGYLNSAWNGYGGGALTVKKTDSVSLTNSEIRHASTYDSPGGNGIYIDSASPLISNVHIAEVENYAVYITNNPKPQRISGITSSLNKINAIRVAGSLNDNHVFVDAGLPWHSLGTITVPESDTLTIDSGAVLVRGYEPNYVAYRDYIIDGYLDVRGTENNPVIFTSIMDTTTKYGSLLRDTIFLQESIMTRDGGWGGIIINNGAQIKNAHFHYGSVYYPAWSGNGQAMIQVQGGNVTIDSTLFQYAQVDGDLNEHGKGVILLGGNVQINQSLFADMQQGISIRTDSDSSFVHYSAFENLSVHGVYTLSLTENFDATLNWWGDSLGPKINGMSTLGSEGENISSLINYEPWLCEENSTRECTEITVGIDLELTQNKIAVSRNGNILRISVPEAASISLYNAAGQLQWQRKFEPGEHRIQLESNSEIFYLKSSQ